jgi:acyl-CoA reductase-like NAD-dependent aldehyde dehydrogenase
MNDSEFGLTASIWTKDTAKGAELATDVDAGTVFINRCDFPSPVSHIQLPPVFDQVDTDHLIGSRMDGMEEFWERRHFECLRIRTFREAEEFPY